MQSDIGKKVVNIGDLLAWFEAQEGELHHITGKTGHGKTYEGTRRALAYLYSGYTVYTTWRLNLPQYYDEREHFWPVLRNILLFRKNFFRFHLQKNWKYVDLRSFEENGIFNTEKFARFMATRTDCIFMLDEGQDVFDAHQRAGKIARQSITRMRHMHMTLVVISQRAQAVDVTARGNVTYFYKCEKREFPLLGTFFRVYRTEEIDESNNHPIWARHDSTGRVTWEAERWHSARAKQWIYDAYDSWYMRQNTVRSQDIKLEAFRLTITDRFRALFRTVFGKKPQHEVIHMSTELSTETAKDATIEAYGTSRQRELGTARKAGIRQIKKVGTPQVSQDALKGRELLRSEA